MIVLIVDDMTWRVRLLEGILASAKVQANIRSRPNALSVSDMDISYSDVIFLDRDLCCGIPGGACPESGLLGRTNCACPSGEDLVSRILALTPSPGQRFVVHSMNPDACQMATRLANSGRTVVLSPVLTWKLDSPHALVRLWGILKDNT
jgi:hypothetical protein